MSTTTLPRAATAGIETPEAHRITLYGDFNCPWSYLAFRRAQVLSAADVEIDWRAVEYLPHGRASTPSTGLREEMQRVLDTLPPDEELPHDVPGFLPQTAPAIPRTSGERCRCRDHWRWGHTARDAHSRIPKITDDATPASVLSVSG